MDTPSLEVFQGQVGRSFEQPDVVQGAMDGGLD